MKLNSLLAACAVLSLSACANPAALSAGSRVMAKQVVNSVVATRLPGVDASAMTDCVIDNATDTEILSLAAGAVTGSTEAASQTVLDIAGRSATQSCMVKGAQATLLTGGGLSALSGLLGSMQ